MAGLALAKAVADHVQEAGRWGCGVTVVVRAIPVRVAGMVSFPPVVPVIGTGILPALPVLVTIVVSIQAIGVMTSGVPVVRPAVLRRGGGEVAAVMVVSWVRVPAATTPMMT